MSNKNTIIYAAFPGTGKSYLCEKTDVDAVEVEYWKYKEGGLQDKYVEDIKANFGKVDYILISTDPEGLELLYNNGFFIHLVYPLNDLKGEYLSRYIDRGSPENFMGLLMKYWHLWLDELKGIGYCQHIILGSGKYLHDVILKLD
jgi:hypothetical protein